MNYQLFTVAPYWIKTQILRRKGLTPPVLYKWGSENDDIVGNGKEDYTSKPEA
jgi:hypothetical protein